MTNEQVRIIRKRAWHYLTPDVAACAGLTLDQMKQFTAHAYLPTDEQLLHLARRMGLTA
jgi:hypothetical protein